ncbi:hypothetical protein THAOC_08250, partial [Thalassiosira oceanica]
RVHLSSELDIESYFLALKKLRGVEVQEEEPDFDGILAVANETGNQTLRGNISLIRLDLKVFFGEWKEAAEMLNSAGDDVQDALLASFSGIRWTILEALFLSRQLASARIFSHPSSGGEGRTRQCKREDDTAEKNGFLQDQALSNELASLYFESIGDTTQKSVHRENAIRCYSEWGATAKVEQLRNLT